MKKAIAQYKFKAVGTSFRADEIRKIVVNYAKINKIPKYRGMKNEDLVDSGSSYEYEYRLIKPSIIDIVPEPTNPYDPNALAVWCGNTFDDFSLVGYISRNDISEVSGILKNKNYKLKCGVVGGTRKEVDDLKVRVKKRDYSIEIKIFVYE